ncbi:MAG: NYN domain-containing protein, partial [Acidobacteriota bacterium]|nr:NYN domain-containing protein [Acidobacteriota bacterium]
GDWDMEMALDMLEAAPQLDVLALVSGDGDFTSLVKRVKSMGPRVEVLAFPRNTAKSLLEAADRFQPLDRKFMIREAATKTPAAKRSAPSRAAKKDPSAPKRESAPAV